jgi:hypothetical protein
MLRSFVLTLFLLAAIAASAQPPWTTGERRPDAPDTILYPFHQGIQMIEIDYDAPRFRSRDIDAMIPRAMPPPPKIRRGENAYLFRDSSCRLLKATNTLLSWQVLEDIAARLPMAISATGKPHLLSAHARYDRPVNTGYFAVHNIRVNGSPTNNIDQKSGKSVGLIDSLGQLVYPVAHSSVRRFGRYFLHSHGDSFGIDDAHHKPLLPESFKLREDVDGLLCFLQGNSIRWLCDGERLVAAAGYEHIGRGMQTEDSEATLTWTQRDGLTGFLDARLAEISSPRYETTDRYFRNKRCRVLRKGRWGYIDMNGREVIACIFNDAGAFENGVALVHTDKDGWRKIGADGQLLPGKPGAEAAWTVDNNRDLCCGLRVAKHWGAQGLVDLQGKLVAPIAYQSFQAVYDWNGLHSPATGFVKARGETGWGIWDSTGRMVLPPLYNDFNSLQEGVAYVLLERGDSCGLADRNFRMLLPCKWEGLDPVSIPGYIVFIQHGLRGWMTDAGRILVPPQFEEASLFDAGRVRVRLGKECNLTDTLGRRLLPAGYTMLDWHMKSGRIRAAWHGQYGFLDSSGAIAIPFKYDDARAFGDSVTAVKLGGHFGFIDKNGQAVSEFIYDFVGHSWEYDGEVEVRRDGKLGYVNRSGRESVPCIYDESNGYNKQGHHVRKGTEWLYVK